MPPLLFATPGQNGYKYVCIALSGEYQLGNTHKAVRALFEVQKIKMANFVWLFLGKENILLCSFLSVQSCKNSNLPFFRIPNKNADVHDKFLLKSY